MEFRAACMAQLREFGLSNYAGRAYLALLELGVAEARGVSELASIPTAKVYGTLVQLQKRGLAQVSPGKPRKYAPVAMEAFLRREIEEQESQTNHLRSRKAEIAALFPIIGNATLPEKANTITLSGKRNILQRLREACASAKENIFAIMTPDVQGDATIRRLLEKSAQRGIDVHIVKDVAAADVRLLAGTLPTPVFDVVAAEDAKEAILIATFDDQSAILMNLVSKQRGSSEHEVAIQTSERAFVQLLRRVIAMQAVLQQHVDPALVAPAHAPLGARVDARGFDERILERAARPAMKASAVILASNAPDLARNKLWPVATGAGQARVLLGAAPRRSLDPKLLANIPPHVDVRLMSRVSTVAFAVLDGDHAFLISPRPDGARSDEPLYAVTTDAAIVRAFEAQFEASWANATLIPALMRRAGDARRLPGREVPVLGAGPDDVLRGADAARLAQGNPRPEGGP